MSKEVIPISNIAKNIHVGPQVLLGVALLFVAFILFVTILTLIARRHPEPAEKKKKEPKESEEARHLKELKEILLKELRGTSKQNWIMIILTIVFISVTVLGGGIIMSFFNETQGLLLNVSKLLKSLVAK